MFKEENNLSKKSADSVKKLDVVNNIQEIATNIPTSNKTLSNIKTASGAAQSFMNQPLIPTTPTIVEDKVWSKQPTSKIFNAEGISESAIAGINRVVKLEIFVEGKEIKFFKNFKLTQSALKHHQFDLVLAHDTLGSAENHNLEEAQSFLGKRVTVVFKYKDVENSPERNFVGVITEVGFGQDKGSLGNIILTGYSPTILLDSAAHTQSFGGKQEISLNSIADQVMKEGLGSSKFDVRVDAQYGNVSYSSQYDETHYNYLARIAEAYGEQFFYDGEVLHFGKLPPQQKPVTLTYGSNVADVKIKMKAQHVKPSFYGYNSSKNEKLKGGDSKINHTSDIAKRAYEISEKTFITPSLSVAPIKAARVTDVDASQKSATGSNSVNVFTTSGTTSVPFLYPGCTADIEMRKPDSSETSYFTKLMMTEVTHEVDARGYYTGSFEAIAADTGFMPRPEFDSPKAEPQFAKVISNTDPLNQGRVQVQFDWQNGGTTTEFIRVMTPDAGSSDKVSKNRGFMAIPEVDDHIMVNFVHQHPDRPFVMGGMYHGGAGGGGGQGNNVKSLSSKSGHTISLNDAGGITITDRTGGNIITVDGTNTISAVASKKVTLDNGKSSITIDDETITIQAKNIHITGETIVSMGSGKAGIELSSKENIAALSGTTVTTSGSKDVQISAKETSISATAKVSIDGGAGDTIITGGLVKLNS
ncbi:phage baseplate assembly protein V [Chryseobacterium tructae]|uniref:Type VI secretion system Vgr family protein n=1 Tax=Chryseobacterium tructae TaxID=1037380 RepID=A0ABV7XX89_9FLAO|nr:phage baseplate assembly protein V [Chryseobacterium tructae]MDN3693352.1 phage baseplate assembly protein V [Chryseobacterium tructae]